MAASPVASVFNDGYIAEQWELYRRDPASVEESWRQFFRAAELIAATAGSAATATAAPDAHLLRTVAGAAALIDAYREFGHLAVTVDPLGSAPPGAPELNHEFHGITGEDLVRIPGSALGYADATAADVVARFQRAYASTIGVEFEHIVDAAERGWLREAVESGRLHEPLAAEENTELLRRLTEVDGLERFLQRAYQGYKRFSIEGSDALVPMLDEIIARAAAGGAREIGHGIALAFSFPDGPSLQTPTASAGQLRHSYSDSRFQ
jgi:2-oxoglutarate dehydrogenase E1 component